MVSIIALITMLLLHTMGKMWDLVGWYKIDFYTVKFTTLQDREKCSS